MAGNGAGEGDLPPRNESRAASMGDPAAAVDENDDRRDEGLLLGGFMVDNIVAGTVAARLEEIGFMAFGSGSSEPTVIVEPASDTVDDLLPTDGLTMLNEGAREFLISMTECDAAFPERSRLVGCIVSVLFLWLTECT